MLAFGEDKEPAAATVPVDTLRLPEYMVAPTQDLHDTIKHCVGGTEYGLACGQGHPVLSQP